VAKAFLTQNTKIGLKPRELKIISKLR
jgi:hypothetical protein